MNQNTQAKRSGAAPSSSSRSRPTSRSALSGVLILHGRDNSSRHRLTTYSQQVSKRYSRSTLHPVMWVLQQQQQQQQPVNRYGTYNKFKYTPELPRIRTSILRTVSRWRKHLLYTTYSTPIKKDVFFSDTNHKSSPKRLVFASICSVSQSGSFSISPS